MSVTVDAVSGGTTGSTNAASLTWTHTTAAGATLLLVSVDMNDQARTVTGVTYGGTALTLVPGSLARSGTTGTDRQASLWSLTSPASGSQSIVVTLSAGSSNSITGESATFFGSDTTTPLGTAGASGGTGTSGTVTVSSGASDLVYTSAATRASAATAPSGATSTVAELAGTNMYGASAVMPGGTTTVTWSQSASNAYAVTAVPITASTGSPTATLVDQVGITDTVSRAQDMSRTLADSIGITDSVSGIVSLLGSKVDPIGLTDTVSWSAKLSRPLTDPIGITDTITAVLNSPPPTVYPFPTYVRPPDPYTQAVRSGGIAVAFTVDASYKGQPVTGATGMSPVGGQIVDTIKPGVRRTLTLDLAPEPGLFDLLKPIGTTLTVTAKVTYTNKSGVLIPMGVFDVDAQSLSEGGGKLTLTAPDKWQRIVRAKFVGPVTSMAGYRVIDQIINLIQGALGASESVTVLSGSTATMPALTWTDKDRAKAITDSAQGAGLWVYFDRFGGAVIADQPTVKSTADWLIDASPSGVLLELDRQRSRTSTYNLVVVESSAADGAAFPTQYVFDSDPSSPTYAGPDPVNSPGLAGPFGVVPYAFDTPLIMDATAAQRTGAAILARTVGLAAQVSLSTVPNPAIDAFDAIDVLPPGGSITHQLPVSATYPGSSLFPGAATFPGGSGPQTVTVPSSVPRVIERHVVDTVTHSLTPNDPSGATHIDGRSTRTDAYSS